MHMCTILCTFQKYHEDVKVSWIMDSLVVEYVHDTTMHVQKHITNMSKYHGLWFISCRICPWYYYACSKICHKHVKVSWIMYDSLVVDEHHNWIIKFAPLTNPSINHGYFSLPNTMMYYYPMNVWLAYNLV